MARSVPEWIGKTHDSKVPDRVKLRILERESYTCHLTGLKIDPVRDKFDFDHKIPIILGGSHSESNIFPALREAHKAKTKVEMTVKAKIDRTRKKHIGLKKPSSFQKPKGKYNWSTGRYERE